MHVKKTSISPTKLSLVISANQSDLSPIKQHTLKHFAKNVKVTGFREGKAPLAMVEKNVDQNLFQSHFFEDALQEFYNQVIDSEKIRPASQPKVTLKKFVPYSQLEFELSVDVFGSVTLADYKNLKSKRQKLEIKQSDIDEVIKNMQHRMAKKIEVKREAKIGDELLIDFSGSDDKNKPVNGARGKDYPLTLGSKTFIPGFEDNLIGIKAGQSKKFDLKFPKDYSIKSLANKKVTFKVKVNKVHQLESPNVDDNFANKIGPFKDVTDLKSDIKKQLLNERQNESERKFESDLVREASEKSKLDVPESLINQQIDFMISELKQNLTYRAQTFDDYLSSEGIDENSYRLDIREDALQRVKAGLVLAEIAEAENIQVTKEELDIRIGVLKGQYQDKKMLDELDKAESRRDIASRMMSEKTIAKIKSYNEK